MCVKKFADEIIVVDTGSSDKTIDIAKKFTNKVYNFKWTNDFSAARNFSFSKATKDYIMWLDADDVITMKNQQKLIELKNNIENEDVFFCKYLVDFDEFGKSKLEFYRERILKRESNFKWIGKVHEIIEPKGIVKYLPIEILHLKIKENSKERNLSIYREMKKNNHDFSNRELYYFARELYYNNYLDEAIEKFNGFLNKEQFNNNDKIFASKLLSECYIKKNMTDKGLEILFNSFKYFGVNNPLILCGIGEIYFNKKEYNKALQWYLKCLDIEIPKEDNSFIYKDYYEIIPYIQISICYYYIGNIDLAKFYNEKVGKIEPNNVFYLKNKKIF